MNRRGFLQSMLGLAASAALPAQVQDFLERTATVSDENFVLAAHNDSAIIDLLEARMREAAAVLAKAIDEDLYHQVTEVPENSLGRLIG